MSMLFIQDVVGGDGMIIEPVEIPHLRTLAITTGVDAFPNDEPLINLLRWNPQLENLIIHRFAIGYDTPFSNLFDVINKNLGALKELVIIDSMLEMQRYLIDFIGSHGSLRRFQFGLRKKAKSTRARTQIRESIEDMLREFNWLSWIEAAVGLTYHAECLPKDGKRFGVFEHESVVVTLTKRYPNNPNIQNQL